MLASDISDNPDLDKDNNNSKVLYRKAFALSRLHDYKESKNIIVN